MDWIEELSPHSKANSLSSDVQVDMDSALVDPNGAVLCSAILRGEDAVWQAGRQYIASLTRRGRNHRRRPSRMVSSA